MPDQFKQLEPKAYLHALMVITSILLNIIGFALICEWYCDTKSFSNLCKLWVTSRDQQKYLFAVHRPGILVTVIISYFSMAAT
jgi:hypothetical protein